MKVLNCLQAHKSLVSLSKNKMPLAVSFGIAKNVSSLIVVVDNFYKEREKRANELNAIKDSDSKEAKEKTQAFQKELDELLDTDVDVSLETIDLSKCSDISVAAEDLIGCSEFITIEDANKDG